MTSNGGLFPCCDCPVETSCEVIPQGYVQGKKAFEEIFKSTGVSFYQETTDSKLQPCSYVFEGSGSLEVKLDKTKYRDDNVGISLISTYFETPPYLDLENNYLEEDGSDLAYPYTATSSATIIHTFKFGSHTLKHKQTINYVRDTLHTNIINRSDTQYRTTIDGSLEYCDSVSTVYFIKKDKRTEIYLNNVPIQHVAGTDTIISYKVEATLTGYRGKGQFITTYFSWWKPDKWWLFPENRLSYEVKETYKSKELDEIRKTKEEGEKERQECSYPLRCEDIFLRAYRDKYILKLKKLPKFNLGPITCDLNIPTSSYRLPSRISSNSKGVVFTVNREDLEHVRHDYKYLLGPVYATIYQECLLCYMKPYAPNICISVQYGNEVTLSGFKRVPSYNTEYIGLTSESEWFKDFEIDLPNNIGISKEEEQLEDSYDYTVTFTADSYNPMGENSDKSLFYIPYTMTTWFDTKLKGTIRIKLLGESSEGDTGDTINIWNEPTTGIEDYCLVNKATVNIGGETPDYDPPITEYLQLYNQYCYVSDTSVDFLLGFDLFNEIHKRNITEKDLFKYNKYRIIPNISTRSGSLPKYEPDEELNPSIYPFINEDIVNEDTNYSLIDNVVGELVPHSVKYHKKITISYSIERKTYLKIQSESSGQCSLSLTEGTPPADISDLFDLLDCIPEEESGIVVIDYPETENECDFSGLPPTFQEGSITTSDNSRTINFSVIGNDIIARYIDNFNGNVYHEHKVVKGSTLLMSGGSVVREKDECQNGYWITRLTYYYDGRGQVSEIIENPDPNKQPFEAWKGYDTMYKVTITDIKYD